MTATLTQRLDMTSLDETRPARPAPATLAERALRDTGYNLSAFVVALPAFVIAVTGVALGLGLLVLFVGLLVLVVTVYAARGFADLERLRLRSLLGRTAPRPAYAAAGSSAGALRRVLTPLRDPQSWLDVAWSLFGLATGTVAFAVTIGWVAGALGGLTYWFWQQFITFGPDSHTLAELIGLGRGRAQESLLNLGLGVVLAGLSAGAAMAAVATTLAKACASTAMIYAMHQIEIACMARHGGTPALDAYLREVVTDGRLIASATTEAGIGGDVRSSSCAVERGSGRYRLEKESPVISYGEHADAVLTTARRNPESPASDQVLVLCRRPALQLERRSEWNTLGFRGTCSNGFHLACEDDDEYILPVPYADIASQTMLPTSHIVWSSVWLGLATAATDNARRFVQAEARKKPGTMPAAATHLAELVAVQQQFRDLVHGAARRYDELADDPEALTGMAFAISMNALKVSASQLVVDVVHRAMTICGMAGYRNDSSFTLGRLLRDAHGAALMVNNDRINGNNAQMLLIHRGE